MIAALAVILSAALGLSKVEILIWPVLLLTGAGLAEAGWAAWRRNRLLLISPLFLIGLSAWALFALLPFTLASAFPWPTELHARAMRSEGILATALICGFAGCCSALIRVLTAVAGQGVRALPVLGTRAGWVLAVGAALVSAGHAAWMADPTSPPYRLLGAEGGRLAMDAALPAVVAVLTLLAAGVAGRRALLPPFLTASAALVAEQAAQNTAKMSILALGGSLLLIMAMEGRRRWSHGLAVAMGLAALTTVGLGIAVAKRYSVTDPSLALHTVVETKIAARFTTTHMCFARLLEDRWGGRPEHPPHYFAAALTPRLIWPDKPSLSANGEIWASRYCDTYNDAVRRNSMSTTLLGEPVFLAGQSGFRLAAGVALALLAAVSLMGAGGGVGAVVMVALIPWLADFDQSFAMYLANGVKSGLLIAALVWAALWGARAFDRSS